MSMQELYFHQVRNKDIGPLSAHEIRHRIRAGQIQPLDKLRVDGETVARAAGEFLAFRDEIERVTAREANARSWVCLRARGGKTSGSTSAMCGPYTRGEIVDLLLRHELSPADYVWREGFTAWKRLDSVDQLRLPIPNFPRSLISWKNSQSLDWQTSPPVAQVKAVWNTNATVDRALNGALTLVCGLLAVVVWQLMAPRLSSFTSRVFAHRSHPQSTAAPVHSRHAPNHIVYAKSPLKSPTVKAVQKR